MKLILDLDTGIDDALALAYALALPDVELIGVTAVFGNVTRDGSVENNRNLLALLGAAGVPVAPGAAHAWAAESYQPGAFKYRIHGGNGIGNVALPASTAPVCGTPAAEFIVGAARRFGGGLAVVATGPLTNLADAIRLDRAAMASVGAISIMGGALTVPGNRTPFAEANICDDPEAAKYVFESGLPVTMVGLDVTMQTKILEQDIARWRRIKTPAAAALVAMAEYYYKNESETGELGGAIHDPLALEAAVNPAAFSMLPINLTVVTEGPGRGRTVGDMERLCDAEKSARVAVGVGAAAFVEKFCGAIADYLARG